MISLLAQTSASTSSGAESAPELAAAGEANLFDSVIHVFSSVDMLAQPDRLVAHLSMLSVVWAVVFIVVGMLCLLNGARHYKAVTIGLAFMIGLFAGYWMGQKIDAPYVVGGCLAVLMAVLVFPLMQYAVAIMGGLAGAFVGANLWVGLAQALNKGAGTNIPTDVYWVGALIGLLVCGMLAFILFKFSVVMFTSVSGATIAMLGVITLLLSFQPWQSAVVAGLTASQLVIPLLVFVPAIIGLILQQTWTPELTQPAGRIGGGGEAKKAA